MKNKLFSWDYITWGIILVGFFMPQNIESAGFIENSTPIIKWVVIMLGGVLVILRIIGWFIRFMKNHTE